MSINKEDSCRELNKKIPHKDAMERMNYLYQLAHEAVRLNNESLARFYIYTIIYKFLLNWFLLNWFLLNWFLLNWFLLI